MTTLERTTSEHPDFIQLVAQLDKELGERDGAEHSFYNQFNSISGLRHTVVAFMNKRPVACGAIKEFDSYAMEVKRMFVVFDMRGKGIATLVLNELEKWAREMNYESCVLETGKRQPEAIALYTKNGYKTISNYGQYKGVENSVCFSKTL